MAKAPAVLKEGKADYDLTGRAQRDNIINTGAERHNRESREETIRFGSGPAAVNGDKSRLSHFSGYRDGKAGE
jgi:hypothetical protein